MSVKVTTMVLLAGCAMAAAKPGELDRGFNPELRAWVAPDHVMVAPDGRSWIGGGFDQGDGYSTGDLVRLGENGGVESEPAQGYLSRMKGTVSIGGPAGTSQGSEAARPFPLAGGDFLLKGDSGGWLRMNAAGMEIGKAFPDRLAEEIITPQFERDGKLWVIRSFADGGRRLERRESADGLLGAGFSQAGGAPLDANTAVPGPDGSVWVLAGEGNPWLPFPWAPLPAQRLFQMDEAGTLMGAAQVFEIPRAIELVAGPAGAFRLVYGPDLSRWNYWPAPSSGSLKIEWYSAGGVLERAQNFSLRTYETFSWAEGADGSFVATDATTPIPGSPQFFVGEVANLRAFGPDGVENTEFITPGRVRSVRALADGKWLVDGLRRIHADGSDDSSWKTPELSTPAQVTTLQALPNGRMLAGGNFATVNEVVRNRLVVFLKNGMVDPSFVPDDRIGEWRSITVSGNAVYVVTVEPVSYGAGIRSNLVKLNLNGAIIESYLPQLHGGWFLPVIMPIPVREAVSVRAMDGGSILVETYFGGEVPQSSFHRLNADGTPDPAFKVLSGFPRAYDVITKMNGGFVRGAVIYRKNGTVEKDLTRDHVWLRPLCEWRGGVVFLEFDNSSTGRLRLWVRNRWASWFRPPVITNIWDGVLASPGERSSLFLNATLAAGGAKLHRLSLTGRLDRTFDPPGFGHRERQAAGAWWTAEETGRVNFDPALHQTGRVNFDPALHQTASPPEAILWHPETRRLWVGGAFNMVDGQPRDGLARIIGGFRASR